MESPTRWCKGGDNVLLGVQDALVGSRVGAERRFRAMIKVGDTVMLGVHDELLGSEMVLERTADALTPLGPLDGSRPSGASSTSTRRITFTPARRTTHQVPAPEVEEEDMPLAWQAPD